MIPSVWLGTILAVVLSLLGGILLTSLGLSFEGAAEQIFEGITMLLAAALLTWMIFWMSRTARDLKSNMEGEVQRAALGAGRRGVFFVAFLAILREGIELALFLTASVFASDTLQTLLGALLGLGTAILLGWSIFAAIIRLDLRRFFQVTGFLLILFAAGLVAHGVHEFNEVGWIPAVIEHLWDVNAIVDENSTFGQLLKALFGYNGNPSLPRCLHTSPTSSRSSSACEWRTNPAPSWRTGKPNPDRLPTPVSRSCRITAIRQFFYRHPSGVSRPAVEGRYNQTMLNNEILESIQRALAEDIGPGDATTDSIVPIDASMRGQIIAKQDGVIAGLEVARAVYQVLDPQVEFKPQVQDGSRVTKGQVVALLEGRTRSLLTAERTALNFLGRMSGIATLTRQFMDAVAGRAPSSSTPARPPPVCAQPTSWRSSSAAVRTTASACTT